MKNILSYLFAVSILFMMAGCGDAVVDLQPKDQFTTDVALSTLDGLEGAIYGVYERGRNVLESNDVSVYQSCQTDLVKAGTNLSDQAPLRAIFSLDYQFNGSLTQLASVFDGYYIGLNRANLIIDGIDNLALDNPTDVQIARRDQVLGEAYFFRAYYHYLLGVRWENIVLALSSKVDPNAPVELSGPDVVFPLIITDLLKAVDLLPESAVVNSTGRASKGVARHVLSKVYLYTGEWAKAAEMAELVINDPAYKLQDNLRDIFSITNQENDEILFAWQFSYNDNSHPQRVSHQWYPLYDRVEGVARTLEQGARPWSRLVPSDYYWTLFDENDKRLEAWHKRIWYYDSETELAARLDIPASGIQLGDPVTADNVGSAAGFGMSAVLPTTDKFREDSDVLGKTLDAAEGYRNIPVYRLSEAYLVAAEAYWRSGNTGKGLEFLNVLRKRAGVSEFTTIDQDIILDEQARELGHEGHRWEMLKRMGVLVERVRAHNPEAGANIQDYHVRYPLPRTLVDLTKVPQNEGYAE
ncbi:MAG TPA: RagB/SusD family nutrient uptake outer membrane protein [Prolixibacteraceae bacterium]|nr:RagB/SusD family nutrient uptake outer membrane protein [Prolixibacteraceae bacterium]